MSDHDTRLALAEAKIAQHDKLHEETQAAIRELTAGVNQLVQAEIRREQDDSTFKRLFREISELRLDLENHGKALQAYKDEQLQKELSAYKGVVLKVLGIGALVIGSVLAGHFGGKWIG
jgi:hypothetical protein